MVSCLLFTPRREEGRLLVQALHNRAAYITEQALNCHVYQGVSEAVDCLAARHMDAIVWDVEQPAALQALAEARGRSPEAFLLILASADTSPLMFLRPDIAPTSLILRPLVPSEVDRVACEILRHICPGLGGSFVIQRKGEQQHIPWDRIYYFESRDKKLYVRLRGEEFGFFGTLEGLAGDLPAQFKRCHRSFIVNLEKVEKVRFSENLIYLWDGLEVPLSRGYKHSIKERGSERV